MKMLITVPSFDVKDKTVSEIKEEAGKTSLSSIESAKI